MLSGKDHPNSLKSLPEILQEELNGEIGSGSSAEISETQQQERLKDVYKRIHSLETKNAAPFASQAEESGAQALELAFFKRSPALDS